MRSDPTHADFAHAAVLSVSYTRMMYACAAAVDSLIAARPAPLRHVCAMTDQGRVRNVRQLQVGLLRLVACVIPNYWVRNQLPAESATASVRADGANRSALARVLCTADSPPERADLALRCACLSTREGGLVALGSVLYATSDGKLVIFDTETEVAQPAERSGGPLCHDYCRGGLLQGGLWTSGARTRANAP